MAFSNFLKSGWGTLPPPPAPVQQTSSYGFAPPTPTVMGPRKPSSSQPSSSIDTWQTSTDERQNPWVTQWKQDNPGVTGVSVNDAYQQWRDKLRSKQTWKPGDAPILVGFDKPGQQAQQGLQRSAPAAAVSRGMSYAAKVGSPGPKTFKKRASDFGPPQQAAITGLQQVS